MRKLGLSAGIILGVLVVLFFTATRPVDHSPYTKSDYYKTVCHRIDSLNKEMRIWKGPFMAGFSKMNNTPSTGHETEDYLQGKFQQVPLAGYSARRGKPAEGVHDTLYIKAAAIKTGDHLLIFVTADLLIIPPAIVDTVVAKVAKEGIRRENLFFSATHTHSGPGGWGPGIAGWITGGKRNEHVEKWLAIQMTRAILAAIADLKPAQVGTGVFNAASFTGNRLAGPQASKNDDFNFVVLEQTGSRKAILGSFSAHPTTLGKDNLYFSGDYPGYWQRKTEENTGSMALFFGGSTGSQSPQGWGNDFNKARFIGEALASRLHSRLPLTVMQKETAFASLSVKLDLPPYHIRTGIKRNLSTFLSRRIMPEQKNVYLQAVRIGNLVWITTPCDFSGEFAIQIKKRLASKGYEAMVTGFNGSYLGYIIPGRYFFSDKYEPRVMGWFGPEMGEYTMDLIDRLSNAVTKETKGSNFDQSTDGALTQNPHY